MPLVFLSLIYLEWIRLGGGGQNVKARYLGL